MWKKWIFLWKKNEYFFRKKKIFLWTKNEYFCEKKKIYFCEKKMNIFVRKKMNIFVKKKNIFVKCNIWFSKKWENQPTIIGIFNFVKNIHNWKNPKKILICAWKLSGTYLVGNLLTIRQSGS